VFGVDVFERNGEVHDEKIKVVNAPVCELLSADWLYFVALVEGVPKLADEEEILALDQALLDRSGDTFSCFLLIAVVCRDNKISYE